MYKCRHILLSTIALAMLALVAVSSVSWYFTLSKRGATTEPSNETGCDSLTIYYFYGSFRCHSCQEIEKISYEAVENFYADELADGRFRWLSLNFELDENTHYIDEFNLHLPSLALECKSGSNVRRAVLEETWDKMDDPDALEDYVITSIEKFRNGLTLKSAQTAPAKVP